MRMRTSGGRYLAAQSVLESASLRAFAELVADLIALAAPAKLRTSSHAELAWEIHRWLIDALSADERAAVAALGLPDGPVARFIRAALARRIAAV